MSGYLIQADALSIPLADQSVNCCVTSPPYYGLRDYGTARWEGGEAGCDHARKVSADPKAPLVGSGNGRSAQADRLNRQICGKCGATRIDKQIGLEPTIDAYLAKMVQVFREVWRVLRDDGTLWLNLGDSYATGTAGSRKPTTTATHGYWENENIKHRIHGGESGLKPKDLIGIPWRVAFALQADGWYLRQDIIWHKPNPMPESVRDRCTKAHEYLFLLSKNERYYYDIEAIKEDCTESSLLRWDQNIDEQTGSDRVPGKTNGPMKAVGGPRRKVNGGASFGKQNHDVTGSGAQSRQYERPAYEKRNRRSVWTVTTKPYKGAHFATFPPDLIEPCILAGCPEGGLVLDPFVGSGTTVAVAMQHGRRGVGLELNPAYLTLASDRVAQARAAMGLFAAGAA